MKQHTAENPEKTRRASVLGKAVTFFRKERTKKGLTELRRWWSESFDTHELAVQAAEAWANDTKMKRVRRRYACGL